MHYAPTMMALETGYKNILLEKPISPDLDECKNLVKKAKEKDANIVILHSLRYNFFYRKMKEIIERGEIGKIMEMRHIEGAGAINYSHSFVRGNFANTKNLHSLLCKKVVTTQIFYIMLQV